MSKKSFGARLRSAVAIPGEPKCLRDETGSSLILRSVTRPGAQPSKAPAAPSAWEHALGAQRARWRIYGYHYIGDRPYRIRTPKVVNERASLGFKSTNIWNVRKASIWSIHQASTRIPRRYLYLNLVTGLGSTRRG